VRKRSRAQRAAVKARPPKIRTEFVGFRTTPEVRAEIDELLKQLGHGATITDAIEAAVLAIVPQAVV